MEPISTHILGITDIGNDPDDVLALYLLLKAEKENRLAHGTLQGIKTTLYKPREKAEIAAKVCQAMGRSDIPICEGFGSASLTKEEFMQTYPFWPEPWGIPGHGDRVSEAQGLGYAKLPVDTRQIVAKESQLPKDSAVLAAVLALAPCRDLAAMISEGAKISQIIFMGGYFGKEEGDRIMVQRAGFNVAIDPEAAQTVLTKASCPVFLFNSQHVDDWKFAWKRSEILAILVSSEKNELGRAIATDLAHYWSKRNTKAIGDLVMADVLTTYVGVLHPELVKTTMGVQFQFNNLFVNGTEPIHMLHKQASTLFTVTKNEKSNVRIVTQFTKSPEELRKQVVHEIVTPLFFKSIESFEKAVREQDAQKLDDGMIGQMLKTRFGIASDLPQAAKE